MDKNTHTATIIAAIMIIDSHRSPQGHADRTEAKTRAGRAAAGSSECSEWWVGAHKQWRESHTDAEAAAVVHM